MGNAKKFGPREFEELTVLRGALNRRAAVEQKLWDMYHGKRDLPGKDECKEIALELGVPEDFNK